MFVRSEEQAAGVADAAGERLGVHGAAGDGHVLDTGDGELQALRTPKQAGELDDSPVCRFHSGQPSPLTMRAGSGG